LLSKASLWRARITDCTDARVTDPIFDPVIPIFDPASRTTDIFFIREPNVVPATPANVERFVESVVTLVPDLLKSDFRNRVRDHLAATRNEEDLINTWRNCVANAAKMSQAEYDQKHATMLGNLACNASSSDRKEIASGIIRNWLSEKRVDFSRTLARVLLGKDGMECAAIDDLDKIAKEQVRNFANAPTPKP
jgi:hypothetical protein